LKENIEQAVTDPQMRAVMLNDLASVLAYPPPSWTPQTLPEDRRRNVLTSENLPDDDPVRKLTNGEALVSPRDDEIYGKALAEQLVSLACAMGDANTVGRFVERMREFRGGAVADFARRLTTSSGCPTLIAKLGPYDRKSLANAAATP
jgi:hypothetical protein